MGVEEKPETQVEGEQILVEVDSSDGGINTPSSEESHGDDSTSTEPTIDNCEQNSSTLNSSTSTTTMPLETEEIVSKDAVQIAATLEINDGENPASNTSAALEDDRVTTTVSNVVSEQDIPQTDNDENETKINPKDSKALRINSDGEPDGKAEGVDNVVDSEQEEKGQAQPSEKVDEADTTNLDSQKAKSDEEVQSDKETKGDDDTKGDEDNKSSRDATSEEDVKPAEEENKSIDDESKACEESEDKEDQQDKPSDETAEEQEDKASDAGTEKESDETVEENKDDASDAGTEKTSEEEHNDAASEKSDESVPDPPPPTPDDILKEIDAMVGLVNFKAHCHSLKAMVETANRQEIDLKKHNFNTAFYGNPGTGQSSFFYDIPIAIRRKTTASRLYAKLLTALKVVRDSVRSMRAMEVVRVEGITGTSSLLKRLEENGGGVVFIDDADQMAERENHVQNLLGEIENYQGKIVFLFAGYNDEMEKLLGFNPSARDRIPNAIKFKDYENDELLKMFGDLVRSRFGDKMVIEGMHDGLYTNILINRLAGSRGTDGFGNGSAVKSALAKVLERQADRIREARLNNEEPDDFFLTKEDLIGPPPKDALATSKAWAELCEMVGIEEIISAIRSLAYQAGLNYQRELQKQPPMQVSLNRLFLGPPGTGKTTVGKLYAQVLADLGLLSSSEIMVRNPSDLIGKWIGWSEDATKSVLNAAKGKVLIIDEAHMLYPGGKQCNKTDIFRIAVIDTLVSQIQNTPGEDRCVILMGYTEQMLTMFANSNPGLARRFPMEDAFNFYNFSVPQLGAILDQKVHKQDLIMTPTAREIAIHMLTLSRDRPNFGNGGEVENLLTRAKLSSQKRTVTSFTSTYTTTTLEPQDFDKNYHRILTRGASPAHLFANTIGQEAIAAQFESYAQIVSGMRLHNIDPRPHIPFTYIFSGPPGTGKTTTARKIGQIFYDMGFLAAPDVLECSVSDLVAEYQGQTGPKVIDLLESALGKVLFVDEAYRLAARGAFTEEAVSELVDCVTKPRYAGKIVIILAGYAEDMRALLRVNRGLASRFATEISFEVMPPGQCLSLLRQRVGELGVRIGEMDGREKGVVRGLFRELAGTPSWANGRDIETLGKIVVGFAFKREAERGAAGDLVVGWEELVGIMREMLRERERRG
ncbi:P-loop containing nucleoside triphosphate hydrolase [Glarea lozoyensis ATCC 20868]|uniref:p-loop containing nucleoside triphosphate hydrolase n=1 Tax=Glarea lozoyensis (strain ATCC 20868 / MF5171) TaxID=1116229 RepID=S3D6Z0_GLAL2|nr:P-loop containing nucleoside triphosphate hydrolase [Glarea lozoyensis ATCC 20868]EPE32899.1 P-loop containing nucleoside triphosphate hydrolase [Glarea lozoyensis ATCC 20868]